MGSALCLELVIRVSYSLPQAKGDAIRFLERLNSPIAVAVVLVLFVVLDGLLLYRYQLRLTESNSSNPPLATTTQETTQATSTSSTKPEETTAGAATTTKSKGNASSKGGTTASTQKSGPLRVVVGVEDAPTWLKVDADGRTPLAQQTQPGFSQEFEANQSLTVEAGDAAAVAVEVNGEDLGRLGTTNEPTTRTFEA